MAVDFSPLFNQIRACRVTLFIGSGFSLKAGAPSCSDICTAICEQSPQEYREDFVKKGLANLADEFVQIHSDNRAPLINLLNELFKFEYKDLSDHIALTQIPHFKTIFTTNYDSLLEDTYADRAYVVRCNEDAVKNSHSNIDIYKLHGDFVKPEDILITQQDYYGFYRDQRNPLMWDIVKSEFVNHPILFIGYSLEDDNIYYLLQKIQQVSGGNHQPIYLIAPNLREYKIQRLNKLGVVYFNAYASEFLAQLTENIKENIVEDLRNETVPIDVFRNFCKIHHVETSVITNDFGCTLASANPTNDGKHQLNFSVKISSPETLSDFDANSNAVWRVTPTLSIPCIEFTLPQLCAYSHTLNGITLHTLSDINRIRLAPKHEKGKGKIIVPNSRFFESVCFVKFFPRDNCQTIKIDTPIGILIAETSYNNSNRKFSTTLKFNQADTFESISSALLWFQALGDIWRGELFKFDGIIKSRDFFKFPVDSTYDSALFSEACVFCYNLQDIECLTGDAFNFYDGFCEQTYDFSSIVLAFLNRKAIKRSFETKAQISLTLNNLTLLDKQRLEIGDTIKGISVFEKIDKKIVLCGREFIIPFKYTVFKKCKVVAKNLTGTGNDLELSVIDKDYFELYTDICDADYTQGYNTIRIDF